MLNGQKDPREVRALVNSSISRILRERELPDRTLKDSDKLSALGFASLDMAQLVFDLENTIGSDPFEHLVPITSVRTVGDLVEAYLRLYIDESSTALGLDDLRDFQRAGAERRTRRGLP